jgi:hypothetical protein
MNLPPNFAALEVAIQLAAQCLRAERHIFGWHFTLFFGQTVGRRIVEKVSCQASDACVRCFLAASNHFEFFADVLQRPGPLLHDSLLLMNCFIPKPEFSKGDCNGI